MNEMELLDALIGKRGLATILGWTSLHIRPARVVDETSPKGYSYRTAVQGDGKGFPDLLLAKTFGKIGRVIYAELKGRNGKPTPEQIYWLDLLTECWQETYLFRPDDIEEIKEILTMGHVPTRLEQLELKSSWVNQRSL